MRTAYGKALVSRGDLLGGIDHLLHAFDLAERTRSTHGLEIVTPILVDALRRQRRHQEARDVLARAIAAAPDRKSILSLSELEGTSTGDPSTEPVLVRGRIKRLLAPIGRPRYGFLTREDDGKDIYFSERTIGIDLFSLLTVGKRVEAQVIQTDRGWQASSIRLVSG